MSDAMEKPLTRREEQAQRSREAILDATITCLAEFGYAETSTSRITEMAGVSRGALTHHFKSKEDLIVETTNKILRPTTNPPRAARQGSDEDTIRADLTRMWQGMLKSHNIAALVEVLLASRTDTALRERIKPELLDWDQRINASQLQYYQSTRGDDEQMLRLWSMARVFFRGLFLHDAYVPAGENHKALAEEFIGLIAPLMKRR